MIELIHSSEKERLRRKLQRIGGRSVALNSELLRQVGAIVDDVRNRGDAALIDYARQFDDCEQTAADIRVTGEALQRSAANVEATFVQALVEAITNIRTFHDHERQQSWEIEQPDGVRLGQRITPIERVGLYVPGGTASYPSSVVMNVVPAQVAGAERIVVTTPPRSLQENPCVAAALIQLGVTEVYAVGGAQAIAALAYGTETVPRVDKITGPGNKYVAAAKKLVFGTVGIDSVAGPTEVVIIADETARADFVAADMLAQAEHAEDACAVLITTSEQMAKIVSLELSEQTRGLSRRAIIEASLRQFGAIIVAADLDEAGEIASDLAPEHLEIVTVDDDAVATRVKHAGAIFFGSYSPEVVGDYFAGPNHVLPTARAARFSSALGVYDFVKRTSLLRYSRAAMTNSAEKMATLARAEGLDAHARSARIRVIAAK